MTIKRIAYASIGLGLSGVLGILAVEPAVLAQPLTPVTAQSQLTKSDQTTGTLRQGLPGRRLGGGTRSDRLFTTDYAYLAAMILPDNLSVTTAERPSFMFYIPEMVADQTVEFALRNESDELIYQSAFQVGHEGGMISLNTAKIETMAALTVNETYRWYFSIVPEVSDRAHDVVVHGNIRRVEPAAWLAAQSIDMAGLEQLATENPLIQARALYQQANLWHDAAVLLDELRRADPNNTAIADEWRQLLTAAGLATLLETPQPAMQISLK